ncbi:hypothetical protein ACFL6X_02390 [Candidatus Latescibacterota bacterium]
MRESGPGMGGRGGMRGGMGGRMGGGMRGGMRPGGQAMPDPLAAWLRIDLATGPGSASGETYGSS